MIVLGEGVQIAEDRAGVLKDEISGILSYPDSCRRGHFWCFGTMRTGKTRLLENMVEQDIRRGYSTVVIDPKGDFNLLAKIVQATKETGRLNDLMLTTPIGEIICTAPIDIFIDRLKNGKRAIMVVHPGAQIQDQVEFPLGKFIISKIQSYVGRVLSDERKVTPPLSLFIDEAQSMLYYGIDDLFSKAGAADVWVHGFSPSASQMYAVVGEDHARVILDNTNTKILMRVLDTETVKYIADLTPHDVKGLNAREFYMMTYSGLYKGRSLDVTRQ